MTSSCMLLGGNFNRTAVVDFPSYGMQMTIRQFGVGQDAQGYLRMRTVIDGDIPSLPVGVKLEVNDYSIDFSRSSTGMNQISTLGNIL